LTKTETPFTWYGPREVDLLPVLRPDRLARDDHVEAIARTPSMKLWSAGMNSNVGYTEASCQLV
jgi:hypothetical protein